MDRRTYLRQMALVTGGVLIAPSIIVSCSDKLKNIKLASSLEPFKTLEEIRHFVRLSEGNLKLELERLIKKKDAEAIFNFVNQRIVSIPGSPSSIASCAYDRRWGKEAMLRCGKGTLREKSDLLFYALSEAGFSPDYHRANFLMTPELVRQVYCREWSDNNTIEVDEAYLDKWDDTLNPTENEPVTKSVDLSEIQQLSKRLLNNLPEGYEQGLAQVDWLDVSGIEAPIVRVNINGSVKDLNFIQDKTFSEFDKCGNDLYDLDINEVNVKLNKVRISVNATFSNKLDEQLEIVKGEWEISELLGNQIALQCIPTLPQEAILQVPIKDIQQFLPVLSLQNPRIPLDERINYSFKGVGFDLMGNTFLENENGTIQMNGLELSEPNQKDTSSVSSLKVELLDHEYPAIKLKCLPLDDEGKPVLGLSSSAFEIFDQKKRQFPIVLQNSITTRVLMFFDSTASMPYPYAASEIPEETLDQIYSGFDEALSSVVFETRMFQLNFLEGLSSLELKQYDHILCIGDG
ncbi:MAG: hypothetical protein P8P74_02515, partial [Crocinitomicaceae bacterium]|nr:hypothetical protein [Crocinitomicaceae bacterium]